MRIGTHDLDERILIVAEIGNNHEGKFEVAEELVRLASACRVDAVKFQTFRTEHFVSSGDSARFERLKRYELTQDQFRKLGELARSLGLLFLSTPLDLQSAVFLSEFADALKIASGDNNFFPLIDCALGSNRPVIISTGASTLEQIDRTVAYARERLGPAFPDRLALLHCTSAYPVPPGEVHLRAIPMLAARYNCTVGFSDHSIGMDAAIAACALGARIIEKHFTLNKNYSDFRDHQLSADPGEMAGLVRKIRELEPLLGSADKAVQPSEAPVSLAIRRSIVAARTLDAGHIIGPEDLMWIRPAGGLSPGEESRLIGGRLRRAVAFGERLALEDIETAS